MSWSNPPEGTAEHEEALEQARATVEHGKALFKAILPQLREFMDQATEREEEKLQTCLAALLSTSHMISAIIVAGFKDERLQRHVIELMCERFRPLLSKTVERLAKETIQ